MPGCQKRQKQSIKEDAMRTWYTRTLKEEYKKKRKNTQKEKRMDEHGIRAYGIAKETT